MRQTIRKIEIQPKEGEQSLQRIVHLSHRRQATRHESKHRDTMNAERVYFMFLRANNTIAIVPIISFYY